MILITIQLLLQLYIMLKLTKVSRLRPLLSRTFVKEAEQKTITNSRLYYTFIAISSFYSDFFFL
jgi:hypothetical protein